MRHIFTLSLLFLGILSTSCNKETSSSCNADYDQGALFRNMADAVIIPSFTKSKNSVADLDIKIDAFVDNPTSDNLAAVRTSFRTAYLDWQTTEYFNFGPSESIQLNTKMNNFPVSAALLEANISFGEYNLDAPDNYYSGFPALDYLLYGVGDDDAAILAKYTSDENAQEYLDYLSTVIDLMLAKLNVATEEWTNNYRNSFIGNEGTADGTSISLILNSLNENFENTRRARLGIPSGFHELNVPAFPDKVEGYYSGLSLELLKRNMQSAKDYFNGLNGEGIDDYLEYSGMTKENINLEIAINNQFDATINALNEIPETLAQSIVDFPTEIQDAYVPLANQVVLLKTDTPSALCVSITYIDNASDSD